MPRWNKSLANRIGNLLTLSLVAGALGAGTFVYMRWKYREQRYNQFITETAERFNVDKFLIKAVIRRESEFDPFVLGRSGEIGLMQVTEGAGRDWARANDVKDFRREMLWNERINIEAGTWYLGRALRRWQEKDDPLPFALAEYNAGFGNCLRWLPHGQATTAEEFRSAISFPTVRRYVETVREFYEDYRANGTL